MKTLLNRMFCLLLLAIAYAATAYAKGPVYSGVQQHTVTLTSNPAGAAVYLNGKMICASTPATVTIPCSGWITPDKKNMPAAYKRAQYESRVHLVFQKEGYLDGEVDLVPTINPGKGKSYNFRWPSTASHVFQLDPKGAYAKDPTITAGEATNRVSRDRAGKSDLERTIIRWFFDSDPRGARIYWRVISSIPAEVKNTNETYLMTTPFRTRCPFSIPGLTYENSSDVQIEIQVCKEGYEKQNKLFNVRQAIDQQEICSFFALEVKE